jgi:tRNA nucleotidyltransferase (CCA-adding enzyme)
METIKEFAKIIGGKCYLIGGAVIDSIQGREIKDWDIEVYGKSLSEIENALKCAGLEANMVGASFGVIKTKYEGLDIDLSVPRRENRVGIGHKGFEVEFDPSMTPKEAGRRRDLTINSMYLDIETGEIVDHFGGLADLENGTIRATDSTTFIEDPLRVLRIMQLLPRKGRTVDLETVKLCRSMLWEFNSIPKERIFAEFEKLMLKADEPSMGIDFLKDCIWILRFPELTNLIGCEQNKEWHPEGDVFEHTMRVIDLAASYRDSLPEDWRLPFMFGALLHDVGKPSTTDEDLTSKKHDVAGGPIAETFMRRITDDKQLIERVVSIVVNHMRCGQLSIGNARASAWKRLHNELRLDVAAAMSKVDSMSRYTEEKEHEPSRLAMEYFEKFGETKIQPVLMGRHLVNIGMKPGPQFKKILDAAYQIQIEEDMTSPSAILERVTGIPYVGVF